MGRADSERREPPRPRRHEHSERDVRRPDRFEDSRNEYDQRDNDNDDYEYDEHHNPLLPHWAQWAPSKAKLWLALGPIIAIPLIINPVMWVGRPWMTAHAPWLLIMCSNKVVYLALAATQISAIVYYAIAIIRRLLFAPCYFFIGKWAGDTALDYLADSSPSAAATLDRFRRWFPTAGPLLIMFYPSPIVRLLAGSSSMKFSTFAIFEVIGATSVAIAVRTLAMQFPEQMDAIIDFITRYTWQLTIASIVLVIVTGIVKEAIKPSRQRAQKFHELEEAVEAGIEREEHHRRRDRHDGR